MTQRGLEMWTIYDHPSDYPEGYIARCYLITVPEPLATDKTATGTLPELRARFEGEGLFCIPRYFHDDPCILEVWL